MNCIDSPSMLFPIFLHPPPLDQISHKIVAQKSVSQAPLLWESKLKYTCSLKATVKLSGCESSLWEDLDFHLILFYDFFFFGYLTFYCSQIDFGRLRFPRN